MNTLRRIGWRWVAVLLVAWAFLSWYTDVPATGGAPSGPTVCYDGWGPEVC